jgi:hypothetical protein
MNIYSYDKEAEHGIRSLKELKPVDARTYVNLYYGATIETTNPYYFGDHDRAKVTKTKAEQQKIVNANIKVNDKAVKGFEKFEVLTLAEVQAMFTKMKLVKTPVKKAVKKAPVKTIQVIKKAETVAVKEVRTKTGTNR